MVDVARQLFAKNGVDDTTMNDIAVASKKGRRTLYTYFKSKEDIYMAVVESELEMLSGAMEKVAEQDIAPDTKILRLIECGGVQDPPLSAQGIACNCPYNHECGSFQVRSCGS